MKKQVPILSLVLIFSLQIVSSLKLEMKDNFQPGETLLASLEGNFLSQINPEDIYFYSGRVQIPIVFDISRINEKYYLYALLPDKERNYTFIIKNLHYFENSQEKREDFQKTFSVSGNTTEFSVYPGFVITKENFTITVESKNQALDITAKILNQTQTERISMGKSKKLQFSVRTENFTLTSLLVSSAGSSYEITAAILSSSTTSKINQTVNIAESDKFSFTRSDYNFSVKTDSQSQFKIYLKNVGESEINRINLRISDSLKDIISVDKKTINLSEAESKEIILFISSDSSGTFLGKIIAENAELSASSDIIVYSSEDVIVIPEPTERIVCSDYGGIICSVNQQCSTKEKDTLDGKCCTGLCGEKKSYWGIIIGIILILAVAAGIFFLYKRQKAIKQASPKEMINQKSRDFEKRILGEEARGSLSRS